MERKLTEDEINMLKYFWDEKRDIERYYKFNEIKSLIHEEKPEILKAWNDYKASIKTMNDIMNNL